MGGAAGADDPGGLGGLITVSAVFLSDITTRNALAWFMWGLCLVALGMMTLALASLAHAGIVVIDDSGREVRLEAPARRVVTLAPHLTEMLFAVGAGDTAVGAVAYSDYPPAALELPRVGGARGVDVEAVLALEPDLVLAWASAPQGGAARRLESLGIPVFRSNPGSLEAVARTMQRIGRLVGHAGEGEATAAALLEEIARLRAEYGLKEGRHALPVFYEVWHEPLMTIGGAHFISEIITLCGGENIFSELDAPSPRVDMEALLARNPQVILSATSSEEETTALRARWRKWPELAAVSAGQIRALSADQLGRPGPRLAAGARQLCRQLEQSREDILSTQSEQ